MNIDSILKFYSLHINCEEIDKDVEDKNRFVIEYLLEAGVQANDIITMLLNIKPETNGVIKREEMTKQIVGDTLIKNDIYYYHNKLRVFSKPPSPGEEYSFYNMPKIIFTENDALDYFYSKFNINKEWTNKNQDIGGLTFLLNEYKKFNFVEPIDFFLGLVDYTESARELFDLRKLEMEYAEILDRDIKNAKLLDINKYTWR